MIPHGQFHVDNYVLSRKDRTSHGGGVALYVRSDILHRRRLAFYDIFSTLCDLILLECRNTVIPGDYNCDLMVDTPLKDIFESFYLQNLISDPTCLKKQNGSLIDLCLVWNPLRFKKALNLDCWLSDWHNFICITTKLSVPCEKLSVIMYRSLKNFVDDYFICDLYHLMESLNFDNKVAINTCFKNL